MPDRKPIYGLVCAGGGAHGAYQVGVLKYIHEHFCNGAASPFRIFCGTSAGSLNTIYFACRSFDARDARLELEQMWLDFDVPRYHGKLLPNAIRAALANWGKPSHRRKVCWSVLDPDPLKDVVDHGFNRASLDRSFTEGTTLATAVSATELRSSRLVWFVEGPAGTSWNSGLAIAIAAPMIASHVVASCSVPFIFPPVKIGEHYFLDGGVANTAPFGPAVNMGATRILSVATDRPLPDELPAYPEGFKPGFSEVLGMLADQLRHDYVSDQARLLEIINYFREQLPVEQTDETKQLIRGRTVDLENLRPVEIELFAPSRRIGSTDIYEPEVLDPDLKKTGTALHFEKEFVAKLIDFGYEDAAARHDQLEEFFDPSRPPRRSAFAK